MKVSEGQVLSHCLSTALVGGGTQNLGRLDDYSTHTRPRLQRRLIRLSPVSQKSSLIPRMRLVATLPQPLETLPSSIVAASGPNVDVINVSGHAGPARGAHDGDRAKKLLTGNGRRRDRPHSLAAIVRHQQRVPSPLRIQRLPLFPGNGRRSISRVSPAKSTEHYTDAKSRVTLGSAAGRFGNQTILGQLSQSKPDPQAMEAQDWSCEPTFPVQLHSTLLPAPGPDFPSSSHSFCIS
ncbi:hypothetical protein K402DRAFT_146151 [Aulographum hederae CBS 113979]|uniref:Uncharacterized protein n=1 Tax=Aulographum hederae CBS 113979 TaxID=1176131 RepID=A0A6G1GTY6_9PEZI|nr:hypothetical protein K402DRAFT_146151 [Aulographum hederae CBS 113979]